MRSGVIIDRHPWLDKPLGGRVVVRWSTGETETILVSDVEWRRCRVGVEVESADPDGEMVTK